MKDRILSAGVVVVRRVDETWRVLLLRAYNYWDFPKGLVEPGEDPLATARREVREETGIADLDFRWARSSSRRHRIRRTRWRAITWRSPRRPTSNYP